MAAGRKELSLSLKIKATAAQARAELAELRQDIQRTIGAAKNIGGNIGAGASATMRGFGKAANIALAPIKMMSGIAAVTGGAVAGLGLAAINAAADYETLQLRLEAVMGSAKDAKKAFDETIKFAEATPFEAGDLVDARIMLEGIGIKGPKALKSTANAAAAMGRSVADMSAVVASLETEPLRRLGIAAKREGDNVESSFRDAMGRIRRVIASGADASRQALLGIFDAKFGNAVDKLAGSWNGMISTLKDGVRSMFVSFGTPLMESAKPFIQYLNDEIGKLVKGGKLAEMGKQLGAWLSASGEKMKAALMTIPQAAQAFSKTLGEAPGKIGDILGSVMVAVASIFVKAVVESWVASIGLFTGIGKILAASFMEEILQLPGMKNTRYGMMGEALKNMTPEEYKAASEKNGFNKANFDFRDLSDADQAAIAASGKGKLIAAGIDQARNAVPDSTDRLKNYAMDQFAKVGGTFTGATGFSIGDAYSANLKSLGEAKTGEPEKARYYYRRPSSQRDNTGRPVYETGSFVDVAGKYNVNEKSAKSGAVIISIENLTVQANDTRNLQNELIRRGGMPAMAAAGT